MLSVILQDLEDWGPDTPEALEARHSRAAVRAHLKDGLIERAPSPIGEVIVLTPGGYRALGYKFQWYKPTERAILDRIALRQAVQALEAEGYTGLERVSRERERGKGSSSQRSIARMQDQNGRAVYVLARLEGYGSSAAKTAISKLWDRIVAEDARVIVFHPKPKQIERFWVGRFEGRVTLRLAPWAGEERPRVLQG